MNQDASVQAAFAKTGRKCEDMTDNDLAGPTPAAVYSAPLPPQVPPPPPAPAQVVPQPAQPQPCAEPGGERGQNERARGWIALSTSCRSARWRRS